MQDAESFGVSDVAKGIRLRHRVSMAAAYTYPDVDTIPEAASLLKCVWLDLRNCQGHSHDSHFAGRRVIV